MLRLPCVVEGAVFCWLYYTGVGLPLVTFLPTMIGLSADLRQYPLMRCFRLPAPTFLTFLNEPLRGTRHDAIVLGIPSARDAFSLLGILVWGKSRHLRHLSHVCSTAVHGRSGCMDCRAGRRARTHAWFTQGTLKGWLADILERKICVMC
jgi:hypothetical protein